MSSIHSANSKQTLGPLPIQEEQIQNESYLSLDYFKNNVFTKKNFAKVFPLIAFTYNISYLLFFVSRTNYFSTAPPQDLRINSTLKESRVNICQQVFDFSYQYLEGFSTSIQNEIKFFPFLHKCLDLKIFASKRFTAFSIDNFEKYFYKSKIKMNTNAQDRPHTVSTDYSPETDSRENRNLLEINNYLEQVNEKALKNPQSPVLVLDGEATPYHQTLRKVLKMSIYGQDYSKYNFAFKSNTLLSTINSLREIHLTPLYKRVFKPIGICRAINDAAKTKEVNHVIIVTHGSNGRAAFSTPLDVDSTNEENKLPDNCFRSLSSKVNHIFLRTCHGADAKNGSISVQDYLIKKLISSDKRGCVYASEGLHTDSYYSSTSEFHPFKVNYNNNDRLSVDVSLEKVNFHRYLLNFFKGLNSKKPLDWTDYTHLKMPFHNSKGRNSLIVKCTDIKAKIFGI